MVASFHLDFFESIEWRKLWIYGFSSGFSAFYYLEIFLLCSFEKTGEGSGKILVSCLAISLKTRYYNGEVGKSGRKW